MHHVECGLSLLGKVGNDNIIAKKALESIELAGKQLFFFHHLGFGVTNSSGQIIDAI